MSRKEIKIGLFGFGCVGFGLYEVLAKTPGLRAQIGKICVKDKAKKRPIDAQHFTFDKHEILNDDSINVIVELIDNADDAFEIVSAALKKGKAVVTANKKMVAEHFEELLGLQRLYNVPLLYEGAVCASIPIIRNLEEYYDNDLLESIEGIVNGSTNYILTKTFSENQSYAQALQQAQEKGYAETNPSLDTEGFDAKYKLLILLAHAFGIVVRPEELFNLGIQNIGDMELRYAREKNQKIKLTAHAYKNADGTVSAFVIPAFVSPQSKLFTVDDVYNGVLTKSSFADTQFFVGKGAGAHPTASAVLSDISALSYDYRYEYKKLNTVDALRPAGEVLLKVLVRHASSQASLLQPYFTVIEAEYKNSSEGYIVGVLSLDAIRTIVQVYQSSVILIETTPPTEQLIQTALHNTAELAA